MWDAGCKGHLVLLIPIYGHTRYRQTQHTSLGLTRLPVGRSAYAIVYRSKYIQSHSHTYVHIYVYTSVSEYVRTYVCMHVCITA